MKKQKILPESKSQTDPFYHLRPVIECLIKGGNRPLHHEVFYMDRDGWRCDMIDIIDFDLLEKKFDFPPTIILSRKDDHILDRLTWVEIKGGSQKDSTNKRNDPVP